MILSPMLLEIRMILNLASANKNKKIKEHPESICPLSAIKKKIFYMKLPLDP